jgi:hypothetical protein
MPENGNLNVAANEKHPSINHALVSRKLDTLSKFVFRNQLAPGSFNAEAIRHLIVRLSAYLAFPLHDTLNPFS